MSRGSLSSRGSRLKHFGHRQAKKQNIFYEDIDEAMNSSVEHSHEHKSDEEMKDSEIQRKECLSDVKAHKKKSHINLKDLREDDFLDLIAAKN